MDSGAAPENQHLGTRCETCHLAGRNVTPEDARKLTTTQERMCGRCHVGAVEASHPTGFTPNRPLPAEYPLDWKGQVTCSTCHDVHKPVSSRQSMARQDRTICGSCHAGALVAGTHEAGRALRVSGHVDARSRRPPSPIDAYSMRCIECHEERLSLAGDGIRAAYGASNGTGMMNHPIGSAYRWMVPNSGLHPASTLPEEVSLPGGRLSCISCHRPYSQKHGVLVAQDPVLCFHCHDK
jgi:predicted CXXCH cytochrome family protein